MKIAIVVQGRFHAFHLARALIHRGHDVTLITNYPKWAVKRFGLPRGRIRSFWIHGILSKLGSWFHERALRFEPERWLHPAFSRWAAAQLATEPWDVVHTWSGVSEEIFQSTRVRAAVKFLMRGSSHIRTQGHLLEQEEVRTGQRLDRPGPWIIAREEREYSLADQIVVLSTFAYRSFLAEGVEAEKVRLLPLGVNTAMFRPTREVIEARCRRILSGEPLRVLWVGTFSMRKGLLDYLETIRGCRTAFRWRFVGAITAEAKNIRSGLEDAVEFIPKQPERDLASQYAWGDVFIFPTIEDGFPAVLAQAQANGLPLLVSTNCSGQELIREGETGWVLPIRSPEAFVERLRWCDSHREELAQMVRHSCQDFRPRDWDDVAADFESLCTAEMMAKRSQPVA